jgi:aldehyde dehydrogenase (NAD+)
VQQLRAIEQMCDEQESAIAAALASDLGRPAFEARMGEWFPRVESSCFECGFLTPFS